MSFVTENVLRAEGDRKMPQATRSYAPVSHGDTLDYVIQSVARAGLQVRRDDHDKPIQTFELTREGQKAFGTMDFVGDGIMDGVGFMIGWRNSYDKSLSLGICGGERVFLCSNGMMVAEQILFRKHTTNILNDMPQLMDQAIASFGIMRDRQALINERLLDIKLSDANVHSLAVEMSLPRHNVEAFTVGEIAHVVNEWHEPAFDHGDKTAWRFKNAVTETAKRVAERNGLTAASRNISAARYLEKKFASDLEAASVTDYAEVA